MFPVDLLSDVSQSELEESADGCMARLLYDNRDAPEHVAVSDSTEVCVELSNVGFVPLYGSDNTHRILALFCPGDLFTVAALYLLDRWWTVEDVLRTADRGRDGLVKVETVVERIVLYVLNRVVYRAHEMSSKEELPFLCHRENDFAKICWSNGEAVGFYSVKPVGSLFNPPFGQSYQLPVMDSIFVRKCHRRRGFGLKLLEDFVLSFSEERLGLRYPLTQAMYKLCEKYLGQCAYDSSLLWEVEGAGGRTQRSSIFSRIHNMNLSAASRNLLTEFNSETPEKICERTDEAEAVTRSYDELEEISVVTNTKVCMCKKKTGADVAEETSEKVIRIERIEAESSEEQVSAKVQPEVISTVTSGDKEDEEVEDAALDSEADLKEPEPTASAVGPSDSQNKDQIMVLISEEVHDQSENTNEVDSTGQEGLSSDQVGKNLLFLTDSDTSINEDVSQGTTKDTSGRRLIEKDENINVCTLSEELSFKETEQDEGSVAGALEEVALRDPISQRRNKRGRPRKQKQNDETKLLLAPPEADSTACENQVSGEALEPKTPQLSAFQRVSVVLVDLKIQGGKEQESLSQNKSEEGVEDPCSHGQSEENVTVQVHEELVPQQKERQDESEAQEGAVRISSKSETEEQHEEERLMESPEMVDVAQGEMEEEKAEELAEAEAMVEGKEDQTEQETSEGQKEGTCLSSEAEKPLSKDGEVMDMEIQPEADSLRVCDEESPAEHQCEGHTVTVVLVDLQPSGAQEPSSVEGICDGNSAETDQSQGHVGTEDVAGPSVEEITIEQTVEESLEKVYKPDTVTRRLRSSGRTTRSSTKIPDHSSDEDVQVQERVLRKDRRYSLKTPTRKSYRPRKQTEHEDQQQTTADDLSEVVDTSEGDATLQTEASGEQDLEMEIQEVDLSLTEPKTLEQDPASTFENVEKPLDTDQVEETDVLVLSATQEGPDSAQEDNSTQTPCEEQVTLAAHQSTEQSTQRSEQEQDMIVSVQENTKDELNNTVEGLRSDGKTRDTSGQKPVEENDVEEATADDETTMAKETQEVIENEEPTSLEGVKEAQENLNQDVRVTAEEKVNNQEKCSDMMEGNVDEQNISGQTAASEIMTHSQAETGSEQVNTGENGVHETTEDTSGRRLIEEDESINARALPEGLSFKKAEQDEGSVAEALEENVDDNVEEATAAVLRSRGRNKKGRPKKQKQNDETKLLLAPPEADSSSCENQVSGEELEPKMPQLSELQRVSVVLVDLKIQGGKEQESVSQNKKSEAEQRQEETAEEAPCSPGQSETTEQKENATMQEHEELVPQQKEGGDESAAQEGAERNSSALTSRRKSETEEQDEEERLMESPETVDRAGGQMEEEKAEELAEAEAMVEGIEDQTEQETSEGQKEGTCLSSEAEKPLSKDGGEVLDMEIQPEADSVSLRVCDEESPAEHQCEGHTVTVLVDLQPSGAQEHSSVEDIRDGNSAETDQSQGHVGTEDVAGPSVEEITIEQTVEGSLEKVYKPDTVTKRLRSSGRTTGSSTKIPDHSSDEDVQVQERVLRKDRRYSLKTPTRKSYRPRRQIEHKENDVEETTADEETTTAKETQETIENEEPTSQEGVKEAQEGAVRNSSKSETEEHDEEEKLMESPEMVDVAQGEMEEEKAEDLAEAEAMVEGIEDQTEQETSEGQKEGTCLSSEAEKPLSKDGGEVLDMEIQPEADSVSLRVCDEESPAEHQCEGHTVTVLVDLQPSGAQEPSSVEGICDGNAAETDQSQGHVGTEDVAGPSVEEITIEQTVEESLEKVYKPDTVTRRLRSSGRTTRSSTKIPDHSSDEDVQVQERVLRKDRRYSLKTPTHISHQPRRQTERKENDVEETTADEETTKETQEVIENEEPTSLEGVKEAQENSNQDVRVTAEEKVNNQEESAASEIMTHSQAETGSEPINTDESGVHEAPDSAEEQPTHDMDSGATQNPKLEGDNSEPGASVVDTTESKSTQSEEDNLAEGKSEKPEDDSATKEIANVNLVQPQDETEHQNLQDTHENKTSEVVAATPEDQIDEGAEEEAPGTPAGAEPMDQQVNETLDDSIATDDQAREVAVETADDPVSTEEAPIISTRILRSGKKITRASKSDAGQDDSRVQQRVLRKERKSSRATPEYESKRARRHPEVEKEDEEEMTDEEIPADTSLVMVEEVQEKNFEENMENNNNQKEELVEPVEDKSIAPSLVEDQEHAPSSTNEGEDGALSDPPEKPQTTDEELPPVEESPLIVTRVLRSGGKTVKSGRRTRSRKNKTRDDTEKEVEEFADKDMEEDGPRLHLSQEHVESVDDDDAAGSTGVLAEEKNDKIAVEESDHVDERAVEVEKDEPEEGSSEEEQNSAEQEEDATQQCPETNPQPTSQEQCAPQEHFDDGRSLTLSAEGVSGEEATAEQPATDLTLVGRGSDDEISGSSSKMETNQNNLNQQQHKKGSPEGIREEELVLIETRSLSDDRTVTTTTTISESEAPEEESPKEPELNISMRSLRKKRKSSHVTPRRKYTRAKRQTHEEEKEEMTVDVEVQREAELVEGNIEDAEEANKAEASEDSCVEMETFEPVEGENHSKEMTSELQETEKSTVMVEDNTEETSETPKDLEPTIESPEENLKLPSEILVEKSTETCEEAQEHIGKRDVEEEKDREETIQRSDVSETDEEEKQSSSDSNKGLQEKTENTSEDESVSEGSEVLVITERSLRGRVIPSVIVTQSPKSRRSGPATPGSDKRSARSPSVQRSPRKRKSSGLPPVKHKRHSRV